MRSRARSAAARMSFTSWALARPAGRSSPSCSAQLRMTVRMLLKSWATPPASRPMLSSSLLEEPCVVRMHVLHRAAADDLLRRPAQRLRRARAPEAQEPLPSNVARTSVPLSVSARKRSSLARSRSSATLRSATSSTCSRKQRGRGPRRAPRSRRGAGRRDPRSPFRSARSRRRGGRRRVSGRPCSAAVRAEASASAAPSDEPEHARASSARERSFSAKNGAPGSLDKLPPGRDPA